MFFIPGLTMPHLISILASIILLVAAWKQPILGRALFVLLFASAAVTNIYIASVAPESYLAFADLAVLDIYQWFIRGPFAHNIRGIVCTIALAQAFVVWGVFAGGELARSACITGILFLVAIAPLGAGSAFPSTLIMGLGLLVLMIERKPLDGSLFTRGRILFFKPMPR